MAKAQTKEPAPTPADEAPARTGPDPLIAAERAKYERMWAEASYRQWSPGEAVAEEAFRRCGMAYGETLYDAGCGTGRAARKFRDMGLHVEMLDIADNAPGVELPFHRVCLWALPGLEPFDWVFSADVLEHIPTERVPATLDGLARLATKGGFLQIALFEDSFGARIGETLHLTVKPAAWWLDAIAPYFAIRDAAERDGRLELVVAPLGRAGR